MFRIYVCCCWEMFLISSIAKLDHSSTVSLQTYPREGSHHQHGLTNGNFANGIQNGYHHSLKPHFKEDNDLENAHRQSPPVSSIHNKTSATGRWVAPQFLHDVTDRNELIFRRVRGILNKLTPEKFDKLCYRLITVGIDNKTILKGIIILIFEKAVDEQKYCNLYAKLCQRLSHDAPNFDGSASNTTTFLRLLLSKCQEEFETRSKASSAFDKKDGVLSQVEQEAKQVAKRKMLGNIKFIGELGKLELLQEAILHKCIQQLLAKKKRVSLVDMAEDIECLCQIMSTVGKRLDSPKAKNIMDQYFDRILVLSGSTELPTRIKFLLQDVLELRQNKWIPRRNQRDNAPRSVTQMRWEMMGPPSFPYFPPGGVPGMMPPNMPFMGFDGTNTNPMVWLNDPSFTCGMVPPPFDSKKLAEYVDDTKDIFGKPVQKTTVSGKHSTASKIQAKPDLFQPHYMKSKSKSNNVTSLTNSHKVSPRRNGTTTTTNDEKVNGRTNKGNPWNIDPFVPHYNKPTVFPMNEEASKTQDADQSPRVEMKNLPHNSRSNGTTQYNKTLKKDSDISLRPASYLIKKDEKPKSTYSKAEEVPAKLQQFTNLTINDKTNSTSKNKKIGLNKAEIEKKVKELLDQIGNDAKIDEICTEIQGIATNTKYSKMVSKQLLLCATTLNTKEWTSVSEICIECGKRSILTNEILVNALTSILEDSKIMAEANAKDFIATISAVYIHHGLISMPDFMENFQDGRHYPLVLLCYENLLKSFGKDWLQHAHESAHVDLKLTFPQDNRTDEQILKIMGEKNLEFLFPHLCLKKQLLNLMTTVEDEQTLVSWVKENAEGKLEPKLLVHMIVTCAITMATMDTLQKSDHAQKPEKDLQEKEKEVLDRLKNLLKTFLTFKPDLQLEAVYALQIFCFEKGFPKEMLLRLFIIFYNLEIFEEEVLLKWKEDINDAYPGKGKSLFQVNNWLQWLETADEEDEDDGDEDA